jgi:hypothetical protein
VPRNAVCISFLVARGSSSMRWYFSPIASRTTSAAGLAGEHLRVVITHHDHLLLIRQIDPDNHRRHRRYSPQTTQSRVSVAITPGHATAVTYQRSPPAMGHQARSASGGRSFVPHRHVGCQRCTIRTLSGAVLCNEHERRALTAKRSPAHAQHSTTTPSTSLDVVRRPRRVARRVRRRPLVVVPLPPDSEQWQRVGSYPNRKAAISAAYGENQGWSRH